MADPQDETVSFESLLRNTMEGKLKDVHTSIPCVVEKFNDDGTVTVTPAIKRVTKDGEEYTIPSISGVPVLYPTVLNYSITFPVYKGDEGLLIFSERDISQFLSTGRINKPLIYRKHDLSDALFLPCSLTDNKRPSPQVAEGLTMEEVSTGAKIQIANGNVNITGTLIINEVPYLLHVHSGVETGPGTSGPVVGT